MGKGGEGAVPASGSREVGRDSIDTEKGHNAMGGQVWSGVAAGQDVRGLPGGTLAACPREGQFGVGST